MPRSLTPDQIRRYEDDGFVFPIDVLDPAEVAGMRGDLEAYENETGGPISSNHRHKAHLLFTWVNRLARHPRILDPVEDILGPDILLWSSTFFIKEPRTSHFVSWHQDATYWACRATMSSPPGSRCPMRRLSRVR